MSGDLGDLLGRVANPDVPFGEDALLGEDALDESQTPGPCLAAGEGRERHILDDVDDDKPQLETVTQLRRDTQRTRGSGRFVDCAEDRSHFRAVPSVKVVRLVYVQSRRYTPLSPSGRARIDAADTPHRRRLGSSRSATCSSKLARSD